MDAENQQAIEAGDGTHIEEDEFDVTVWKSGPYYTFKYGRYPLPNETEQSREDMKHAMMLELTGGKLFYSPISAKPQRIIDIGTGTGIWAIDMGAMFPSAEVLGTDLHPIQPIRVSPNVKFMIADAEDEWFNGYNFDLVHLRTMSTILTNVPKVLQNSFKAIKPGGWIELQELHLWPQCDDGTMPKDDPLATFYGLVRDTFTKLRMNIDLARDLQVPMEEAGFTNIQCVVKKVPIGPWARDKTLRLCGLYMKMAILELMPSLSEKLFEALGMSAEERELSMVEARKAMEDPKIHRYFMCYFWCGQKPDKYYQ